jgi:hypothetical protein
MLACQTTWPVGRPEKRHLNRKFRSAGSCTEAEEIAACTDFAQMAELICLRRHGPRQHGKPATHSHTFTLVERAQPQKDKKQTSLSPSQCPAQTPEPGNVDLEMMKGLLPVMTSRACAVTRVSASPYKLCVS